MLLVLCLCWVGSEERSGNAALEPERIAQELYSPLFRDARLFGAENNDEDDEASLLRAMMFGVEPHTGTGLPEALEWMEEQLFEIS